MDRIKGAIKYLASEELEGRGVQTKGIHKAADYIIADFKKNGVKPGGTDGSFRQKFPVRVGRSINKEKTRFLIQGPGETKWQGNLGEDFQPMMPGGDAELSDVELVFVGYGISSESYNDFKGVDVKGKMVVILTDQPKLKDEETQKAWEKAGHARVSIKLRKAKEAGAVGAILINDSKSAGDSDSLIDSRALGTRFRRSSRIPFAMIKRKAFDTVLEKSPLKVKDVGELKSLAEIESQIEKTMAPVSSSVDGWKASYKSEFPFSTVDAFNVVGIVEGEKKDEYVVVGAHYDHLGFGPYGSRTPKRLEVHNGADDNASGTVAVMELARRFAKSDKKPGRTIIFIAFSGEERGLVGSKYWVDNDARFPIKNTIAMINFDMIGWYGKDRLLIRGSGTCDEFDGIIDRSNENLNMSFKKVPRPSYGSDHRNFFLKKVPVLAFHTGPTDTYHTPDDDYETLNMDGVGKVINLAEAILWKVSRIEGKPVYKMPKATPRPRTNDKSKSDKSKKDDAKKDGAKKDDAKNAAKKDKSN